MFFEGKFLEIMVIGALALIVVGPKDLPILMRRVGQFVGRMRGMAAEFRASFEELARQSELDELRREVEALRTGQHAALPPINPLASDHAKTVFSDISQGLTETPAPPIAPAPPLGGVMTPLPAVEVTPPPETPPVPPPKPKRASRAKKAASDVS